MFCVLYLPLDEGWILEIAENPKLGTFYPQGMTLVVLPVVTKDREGAS